MEARRFIAACRKLQDLDFSGPTATTLEVAVTEVMPRGYAYPFAAAAQETAPAAVSTPSATRRGQWHELVQHLRDLQYIEAGYFQAYHVRRAAGLPPTPPQLHHLLIGIRDYLNEDDYSLYPHLATFPKEDVSAQDEWVEQHLSVLVFRLAQLTSFDDDLPVPLNYLTGEQTCYGRSFLFRLRVLFHFGAADFAGKLYFDASMLKYLAALNASLGFAVRSFRPQAGLSAFPREFWSLLLSWDRLFAAFRQANRFTENVGQARTPYYLVYDIGEMPPASDALSSNLDLQRQQRNQRRLQRKLANSRLHVDTGGNLLGVRLLQLGLWRAGFYVGAIDGAFGLMSHEALRNLLAQEWEADRPVVNQRKLGRALVSADGTGGNFWAADLRIVAEILEAYQPPDTLVAEWEEKAIWESLENQANRAEWEEEVLRRQREMKDLYPAQEMKPLRRVYYGLRGLIRGAFRAIGRIVNWFVRKIKEVAGAIFNFVKATLKRIQEGIGLFFEGFRYFSHYLLGKAFITTGPVSPAGEATIIATRMRLDFDTTNVISRSATDEDLANHRAELIRIRRGLEFFMNSVSTIFRWIGNLTTPLGWVRLGVLIARLVRRILRGEPLVVPVLV